jgi:glycosyltransferase involved in cell wall biosynthesis
LSSRPPAAAGPRITFAIPFYAGRTYLERTLRSVLAQREAIWQAIVCDDGKEPGIEDLVRSFGDPRLRYVSNQGNLGMAGNFNKCLDIADTEFVTVLHADDELGPTYCGVICAAADRYPKAAAIFCRVEIIGPEGEPQFSLADLIKGYVSPVSDREVVLGGEAAAYALIQANFIYAPTLCFRKSVLGDRRFPSEYRFVLDLELTIKLILDGDFLIGVPDRSFRYRRHSDNATEHLTRSQLRFREEAAFCDRMQIVARERGWQRCVDRAKHKRMIKLNAAYRTLKSVAQLQFGDAIRSLRLLREL